MSKRDRAIETLTVKLQHEIRNRRPMEQARGLAKTRAQALRGVARGEREELRALCVALRALRG